MKAALPSLDRISQILIESEDHGLRERILKIARRLEALQEYNPEQALMVAADLVMNTCRGFQASKQGELV